MKLYLALALSLVFLTQCKNQKEATNTLEDMKESEVLQVEEATTKLESSDIVGKTFQAGELIAEAVHNRDRVLVIAPAVLRDSTWQKFLRDRDAGQDRFHGSGVFIQASSLWWTPD